MSLDWSIARTALWNEAPEPEDGEDRLTTHQRNVVEYAVWGTLTLDLPGIRNEDDLTEWMVRQRIALAAGWMKGGLPDHIEVPEEERHVIEVDGRQVTIGFDTKGKPHRLTRFAGDDEPKWISSYRAPTREELTPLIGLSTNVTRRSRGPWLKRMAETVERNL